MHTQNVQKSTRTSRFKKYGYVLKCKALLISTGTRILEARHSFYYVLIIRQRVKTCAL